MTETELKIIRFDSDTLGAIQELAESLRDLKRSNDRIFSEVAEIVDGIKETIRNVSIEDEVIPEPISSSQTIYFETETQ